MPDQFFPVSFDKLLRIAGAAWLRLSHDGRLLEASSSAYRLLGYPHEQALRAEAGAGIYPVPEWKRLLLNATFGSADPIVRRQFCKLRCFDGRTVHVWISAVLAADEHFNVLFVACNELNSMREALDSAVARYRAIMEQSQNGVFIAIEDRFLFVNTAFAEMLAYRREDLLSVACHQLAYEEDYANVAGLCQALLSDETVRTEFTVRLWMKDRIGLRDVSVRASRVWYDGQWCLLGTVYDITDLRRGEAALRDYARRLRLLSQQVIDVQERERRHLARELHDEIGQQLTLVKLSLEALRDGNAGEAPLRDALASVNTLVEQVRSLSLDLRPSMLDDLGLGATLRWYATRAARVAGLHLANRIDPDFPRLCSETETLFFRIAQEAITNILRHAAATRFELDLSAHGDAIELTIFDDGCGFDPAIAGEAVLRGSSSGLLGMQERALLGGGLLQIESARGKGTWLQLVVPKSCAVPRVLPA